MAKAYTFTVKTAQQIRDDVLRGIRWGLIKLGVANPDVSPKSDYFVKAAALANELAVVQANAAIKADELMPDTAVGDALDRIAEPYGVTRRAAQSSYGTITFSTSQTTLVVVGTQLLDPQGFKYEVLVGGTYTDGSSISVKSTDTGKKTELATGTVLRWITPPAYSAPTATVASPGLTGGSDAEVDDSLRARLYERLGTPPAAGNWSHINLLAEEASGSVQKAFCYPAAEGPSTLHFAVTRAPSATNKSRALDTTIVNNVVVPTVQGQVFEGAYIVGTRTTDVNVDVAFGLSLPAAPSAAVAGPGGGWSDGAPWPVPSGENGCAVTAVTNSTSFTVQSTTTPTSGLTRISWLSPYDWTIYSGTVIGTPHDNLDGTFDITVDTAFPGITTGCFIWPKCERQQAYIDAILAKFALLGPGEKTDNIYILERAFRHPRPSQTWPSALDSFILKGITDTGTEVADAQYIHRSAPLTSGKCVPLHPATITDAPNIFVPRHIGLYPIA